MVCFYNLYSNFLSRSYQRQELVKFQGLVSGKDLATDYGKIWGWGRASNESILGWTDEIKCGPGNINLESKGKVHSHS